MKAIRVRQFGDPEVMVVEDVPDLTPGAGQVLVRIHAAGINPVETYIRSGNYPIKPALPYTPGTDGAGIVEAVGSGVTSVLPGTRVYVGHNSGGTTGTYAAAGRDWRGRRPSAAGSRELRAGRGARRAVRDGLARADGKGPCESWRDRARARRERRRGRRGRADRARRRPHGDWHGRHRSRPRAGARTGRASCARSRRRGVSRRDQAPHEWPRARRDRRDARQRQPESRSVADRAARPHRHRRHARRRRDRAAADHVAERDRHGAHVVDGDGRRVAAGIRGR